MHFLVLLVLSLCSPSCTDPVIYEDEEWLQHPNPPHAYAANMWWRFANYTAKTVNPKDPCYVCTFFSSSVNHVPAIAVQLNSTDKINCIIRMVSREDLFDSQDGGAMTCSGQPIVRHPQVFARVTVVSSIPRDLRCVERMSSEKNVVYLGSLPEDHCRIITRHFPQTNFDCFEKCVTELPIKYSSSANPFRLFIFNVERCRTQCDYSSSDCSINVPGRHGTLIVGDWYWLCGHVVYIALPKNWVGRCALVQLSGPAMVISYKNHTAVSDGKKRSLNLIDFQSINTHNQIPMEYLLWSGTQKFFSLISLQFGVVSTLNELEIVRYNVLGFINATQNSAVKNAFKEELLGLHLADLQYRLVFDQLIAKQGGVCAMIGKTCCTYIPDDDADGHLIYQSIKKMSNVYSDIQLRGVKGSDWDWVMLGLRKFFGQFTHIAYAGLGLLIVIVLIVLVLIVLCYFIIQGIVCRLFGGMIDSSYNSVCHPGPVI